jgi:hypothetical protein
VKLSAECRDSHSVNQSVRGTTTLYVDGKAVSGKQDFCLDQGTRVEYHCDGGEIVNTTQACPQGTVCQGALCVPPCSTIISAAGPGVSLNGSTYVDYCMTDNKTLFHYYCSGSSVEKNRSLCPGYCSSATCLDVSSITCAKVSGGVKLRYQDTALQSWNDTCTDAETAKTYRCVNGSVVSELKSCGNHQVCAYGVCEDITTDMCINISGGDGPDFVILTDNHSIIDTKQDACFNEQTWQHYSCDRTRMTVDFAQCKTDERCVDWECIYPYTCIETASRSSSAPAEVTLYDGGSVVRSETDTCSATNSARWVSCDDDGRLLYSLHICPSGATCDSEIGVCR